MSLTTTPASAPLLLFRVAAAVLALLVVFSRPILAQSQPDGERKKKPSDPRKRIIKVPEEALQAMDRFAVAENMQVGLFAAEPLLANPVAIDVDEKGNVYVCETFRQEAGVEDNRQHEDWVIDDLASKTVADRLALLNEHLQGDLSSYTREQDRLRLLTDMNEDGRADRSVVFVGGFNGPLDGTGAGVLARKGNVFYACIPKLYAFRDDDGDGKADRKSTMHDGFGVRFAYRGHDLHGLTIGPDGRLYFSIGDRGFNVETRNGRVANTETGAILRCELDGSELEIVATGFRNPQELAFDDYGNLFTGDNNSDSGDLARWLHVVEGGDYGWRMAYQYFGDRGPWNREEIWNKQAVSPPAYVIPPVANFADGPAGLAYYPGTGLDDAYIGNFFLCDFRGSSDISGVRTFKVRPNGASFDLIDPELFLWHCLTTDIDFGPDGAVYVSDWVAGWVGVGKGRIYRLVNEKQQQSKIVQQVGDVLRNGLSKAQVRELTRFLAHPDRRVRLEAQFELVRRRQVDGLVDVARKHTSQLARLHAIWGLGQIGRRVKQELADRSMDELLPFLRDPDEKIRAAAIHVLGDNRYAQAAATIRKRLYDKSPRVQSFAALALARSGSAKSVEALIELAEDNADQDAVVRHATAMGLARCASEDTLRQLATHENRAVRMVGVLAARRQASTAAGAYLHDHDEWIVAEAARAIHDVPIPAAIPQLARLVQDDLTNDAAVRRALNAHYRMGTLENANALAEFASLPQKPLPLRQFALGLLATWESSDGRDKVLGMWRPLPTSHDGAHAVTALQAKLTDLLESGHEIRAAAARLAAQFGLSEVGGQLQRLLWDKDRAGNQRAGFLLALATLDPDGLESICQQAIDDEQPAVRAAGRMVLTRLNPDAALDSLRLALQSGSQLEKQSAVAMLARIGREDADNLLVNLLQEMHADKLPAFLRLDALMAAESRAGDAPNLRAELDKYAAALPSEDRLAPFRNALLGGNAERGERLFQQRQSLGCVRCHKVNGEGGRVGPDLTKIAIDNSREYLLASIVDPHGTIAKGYETLVITTKEGQVYRGVVQQKDEKTVTVLTAEDKELTFTLDAVDDISRGKSSMPEDVIEYMTKFDLRDMLEYLSSLK